MKSALFVVSGLLAISPTTASAGGYLGFSLGTEPAVSNAFVQPSGRSLRVLGGSRFGNVSVEGALNGFDAGIADLGEHTVYQLSAALKLNLPLGNNFEAFGRVGIERTWINVNDDRYNMSGNGFQVGGGFEYRLNAVVSNASVFVDYTVRRTTLEYSVAKQDETSRIWALGFTVGI